MFFAKPVVEHEIINDVDGALVAFFRMLRERPDELIHACMCTPYARAELSAADPDEPGLDDLERARRWWVTVNQSFNKTGRYNNGFAVSARAGAGEAKTTERRLARLHEAAARLRGAVIECRPAVTLIETFDTAETLFYVDPPYVKRSRTNTSTAYRREMGEDDHRRLADTLRSCDGTVMLSGYRSELYNELYEGWHLVTTEILKRTSNRHRDQREAVTEVLWSNRPLSEGQLDFAGVS